MRAVSIYCLSKVCTTTNITFEHSSTVCVGPSLIIHWLVIGSGSCPQCNVPLRRNNFRVQLFEDPMVEKEVDIRRRILRDFNKKVKQVFSQTVYV